MNRPGPVLLAAGTLMICLAACGLVEFPDGSGLRFFPDGENEILEAGQPVWVSFPFSPDRESAERILAVADFAGNLPGACRWEENTLSFHPETPLAPGGRYVFIFDGLFKDRRGREYEHHRRVPFFSVFRNTRAPYLVSASPAPGGLLGGDEEIRLRFSRDLDKVSFEEGFTLNPRRPWDLFWEDGSRTAVVRPREGWENLAVHTLSFDTKIKDPTGAALAPGRPLLYLVQDDTERPRVLEAAAAVNDPDTDYPSLGSGLTGTLSRRDAIRIEFSEAMARDKTREAVRLSPRPGGLWFWRNDRVLLFLPEAEYEAGKTYSLEIGDSGEDLRGNRLLPWGPVYFTPRTAFLEARVELAGDGIVLVGPDMSSSEARGINLSPPFFRDYTFIVTFSGGSFDTDKEKLSAMEGFSLSCIFPPAAPSPVPTGWSWTGNGRFSTTFSGFLPASPGRDYYYLLTLKGGSGGARAGSGAVLERHLSQLLKTEEP